MGPFPRNTHDPNQRALNVDRSPAEVREAQGSWGATLYAPGLASAPFQKVPCSCPFTQRSCSERGAAGMARPLGLAFGIHPHLQHRKGRRFPEKQIKVHIDHEIQGKDLGCHAVPPSAVCKVETPRTGGVAPRPARQSRRCRLWSGSHSLRTSSRKQKSRPQLHARQEGYSASVQFGSLASSTDWMVPTTPGAGGGISFPQLTGSDVNLI